MTPAVPSRHTVLDRLPFVWVTGQARSGTTIVTRALAAHPQILSNGRENNYLADVLQMVRGNTQHPGRMRQCPVATEQFIASYRHATWEVMFPEAQYAVDAAQPEFAALSAFSSLKAELADFAETFFGQLHWVLVVRNGVAVVDSRMKHWNLSRVSFEDHCRAWAAAVDMYQWIEGRRSATLVRHEWLLDPERLDSVFRQLQQQLALEHSDAPARFVAENQVSGQQQGATENGAREALLSRGNAWRSWTKAQRATYRRICGAAAEKMGYPIEWE